MMLASYKMLQNIAGKLKPDIRVHEHHRQQRLQELA